MSNSVFTNGGQGVRNPYVAGSGGAGGAGVATPGVGGRAPTYGFGTGGSLSGGGGPPGQPTSAGGQVTSNVIDDEPCPPCTSRVGHGENSRCVPFNCPPEGDPSRPGCCPIPPDLICDCNHTYSTIHPCFKACGGSNPPPAGPDGGSGGGGGGGGGGAPVAGGGGAPRAAAVKPGFTSQEDSLLASITSLAQLLEGQGRSLFQVGFPAYSQSVNYYRTLLGQGGRAAASAAVAPAAEQINQAAGGSQRGILSGYLRGGERDAALAGLEKERFAQVSHLISGVQPGAAQALMTGGLQGALGGVGAEGQGGEFSSTALSSRQNERQYQQTLAEQTRQFNANLAFQKDALSQSLAAGGGAGGANMEAFLADLAERQRQFNVSQQFAESQAKNQGKLQLGMGLGQLLGSTLLSKGGKGAGAGAAAGGAGFLGSLGTAGLLAAPMLLLGGKGGGSSAPSKTYQTIPRKT